MGDPPLLVAIKLAEPVEDVTVVVYEIDNREHYERVIAVLGDRLGDHRVTGGPDDGTLVPLYADMSQPSPPPASA
jgi:hypothetical protein